jgi:hypothetical protein
MKHKNDPRQFKLALSFNAYEKSLLDEAEKVMNPDWEAKDGQLNFKLSAIARQTLTAVAVAIIKDGGLAFPPAVDMRTETHREMHDRLGKRLPEQGNRYHRSRKYRTAAESDAIFNAPVAPAKNILAVDFWQSVQDRFKN